VDVPGDLHIDQGVLDDIRDRLRSAEDQLSDACRRLVSLEGLSVGARPLFDELTEFVQDWQYGLTQIGLGCAEAAEALELTGSIFDQIDQRLGDQLRTCPPPPPVAGTSAASGPTLPWEQTLPVQPRSGGVAP
jgi:hypothetical protein